MLFSMQLGTDLTEGFYAFFLGAQILDFLVLMQWTVHLRNLVAHLLVKLFRINFYVHDLTRYKILQKNNNKYIKIEQIDQLVESQRFTKLNNNQQGQMNNNKINAQNNGVNEVERELMQMGFALENIKKVMSIVDTKEKAIEILLGEKELNSVKGEVMDLSEAKNDDNKMKDEKEEDDDDSFESVEQEYKMVFLARMDLKLSLGKMAAQVASGTLSAFKQLQALKDTDQLSEIAYYEYIQSGQKKIVVKVNSEEELLGLVQKIKKQKINVFVVRSSLYDQLELPEGTITVAAVGPGPEEIIDKLTGHLKLY